MNPHAELIQTIYDNPDDDTPRLVYADWLEEIGFVHFAEFIRIQIEINRLGHPSHDQYSLLYVDEIDRIAESKPRLGDLCRREYELWDKRIAWRRLPPRWSEHRIGFYRRGLLDHWSGPIPEFFRYSKELWAYGPVRSVHLNGKDVEIGRLSECSSLDRIETLHIVSTTFVNAGGIALAHSKFVKRVKKLMLELGRQISNEAVRELSSRFGDRLTMT